MTLWYTFSDDVSVTDNPVIDEGKFTETDTEDRTDEKPRDVDLNP